MKELTKNTEHTSFSEPIASASSKSQAVDTFQLAREGKLRTDGFL
jgi:hypothetical protein